MIGMSIFSGITPVLGSLIGAKLLNQLTLAYTGEHLAFSAITVLLILQLGYSIFHSAISRLYGTFTSLSGNLVSNHIRRKLMEKSKTIDIASFDSPEFYAKMENASREAGTRPLQILNASFSILSSCISMISYIILLLTVRPWAPLLIMMASLPSALISHHFRKKNVTFMISNAKSRMKMEYYNSLLTSKNFIKETRMFHLEDTIISRYQSVFDSYYCKLKQLQWHECLWSLLVALFSNIVSILLYALFAYDVFNHQYTIGDFSLYTGAIGAISSGLMTLISTSSSVYEGTLFIDNLIEFMKVEPTIVPSINPPHPIVHKGGHTLEFNNVSFRYPGTEHYVLHHISFKIHANETIVLVGLNGSGKTTLLKLMTRLYDPTEGQVLLDGRDIREYAVDELYSIYGMIFQDFGRYAVTARENITFGNVYSPENLSDVVSAAVQSNADDFIRKLPKGYETPLMRLFTEDGSEPSIGQWQKLAIARAFYRNAEILILDEPTASLDALAEQEIFNRLNELRKNKTTIFVSHRLSSATIADQILVLNNGTIIEKGTHAELISREGIYHQLFTTQATRFTSHSSSAD